MSAYRVNLRTEIPVLLRDIHARRDSGACDRIDLVEHEIV
jgi:hypothetical protein